MGRGRYDSEGSQPLELRDYLDVVRRRFVLIAVIGIIGAALAFAYASSQEDEYLSTASIIIAPTQVDRAETTQRTDQLVNMFTEREVVRSTSVAAEVANRVEGAPSVAVMQRNLTIEVVDETQVMRITYVSTNPVLAQAIAQSFAEVYLEQREVLAAEGRGGARSRVDVVEIVDVAIEDTGGSGGFTATATWNVRWTPTRRIRKKPDAKVPATAPSVFME